MSKKRPTEPCVGWGVRVGGPWPYLAAHACWTRRDAELLCTESFQRPVRVALVPLAAAKKAGLLKKPGKEE